MEQNGLVTLIIPMYKVEKYLNQCLNSVVNQTYKNLEIILVDDGSPDNCGKIADDYAKKDDRIKVIHKENGGVSRARNDALDIAKGEYIVFEDSDDYLEVDAINMLVKRIQDSNSDVVCGNTINFLDMNEKHTRVSNKKMNIVLKDENIIKEFLREKYFYCTIWGKIYKKSIIGNERFKTEVDFSEDFDFLYRVFKKTKTLVVDTYCMVNNYRIRDDSLANHSYNEKFEIEIELSKNVLEDVKKNYPNLEKNAIGRLQRCTMRLANKYFKAKKEIEGAKHLFDVIDSYPLCLEFKSRAKLFVLRHCSFCLKLLYK